MPVFRNRTAFEITKGIKAFLNLEAGLTRGEVPRTNGAGTPGRVIGRAVRWLSVDRDGAGVQGSAEAPPIFFVVGMSRSGTTWLMRLLNAHPEILCRGEGRFFGKGWRTPRVRKMAVKKQSSSLRNALSDSEYLRSWVQRSVWSRDEDTEEHLNNLTRLAVNYFLAQKLAQTGKKVVGDKTPLLAPGIIEEIRELLPEAKVIHIVRDGRDRAVSLMHYLWNTARSEGGLYPLKPEELSKRDAYRENPNKLLGTGGGIFTEERLRRMASSWAERVHETTERGPALFGNNYAEVRYEDLLERPEEEARRLFELLGAKADRKIVKSCVSAASFEKRSKGREKGNEDPTSQAARKGVKGDWRNVFTERDKEIFREAAGKALIETGYENDLDW